MSQTLPMKVHKSLVIQRLRTHPEDQNKLIPEWGLTVEEYIVALEAAPGEYFVNGVLETPEEEST
jgi:hypothetical protein